MKDMQGQRIDEFFKKGLAEPSIPFDEEHWFVLQEELERRQKRKRVIAWWTRLGGVAAILIAGLFLWDYQFGDTNEGTQIAKIKPNNAQDQVIPDKPAEVISPSSAQTQNNPAPVEASKATTRSLNREKAPQIAENPVPELKETNNMAAELSALRVQPLISPTTRFPEQAITPVKVAKLASVSNSYETTVRIQPASKPTSLGFSSAPAINTSRDNKTDFKPSVVLGFSASPDLNSVGGFVNGQVGLNGGMSLALAVSPRVSVSTGVAYAKKVYRTDFANYKPNSTYKFPVNPLSVSADCRVIDIPLNIQYTVWNKNNQKLHLVAGTSSYIMLDEKYKYNYQDPAAKGPKSYQVRNKNKHYLGVVNLAAGYEKQINNKVSLGIQPYVKLPVADIGYGRVRLESAGAALNINFNLFPSVPKP